MKIKAFIILLSFILIGCVTVQQSYQNYTRERIFKDYLITFYTEGNKPTPDFHKIFGFYTDSSIKRNGGLSEIIYRAKANHFLRSHNQIVFMEDSLRLDGNEFEYKVYSCLKVKTESKSYFKLSGYIVIINGKIDFLKFNEPEVIFVEETIT